MNFREMIEAGERAKGGVGKLAEHLTTQPDAITAAKSGKRGLPVPACYALAKLIGMPEATVTAASELVTEKKPERRAILLPFVQSAWTAAQRVIPTLAAGTVIVASTASYSPPAEASTSHKDVESMYIMSNRRRTYGLARTLGRMTFIFRMFTPWTLLLSCKHPA